MWHADRRPRSRALVEEVKAREHDGYAYDGAEASFELLARDARKASPTISQWRASASIVERRFNAKGKLITASQAAAKVGSAMRNITRSAKATARWTRWSRDRQGAAAAPIRCSKTCA